MSFLKDWYVVMSFIVFALIIINDLLTRGQCQMPFDSYCYGEGCPREFCDMKYIRGSCIGWCEGPDIENGWYNGSVKVTIYLNNTED